MNDLISREDLKRKMYHEAFETDSDLQKWDSGCWIRYKLFECVIDSVPSIEKVGEWIPCSEWLPKEQGHYLVTARFKDKLIVMSDDYFAYGWDDFENKDVIAWMPLPTPYIERRKVIGE